MILCASCSSLQYTSIKSPENDLCVSNKANKMHEFVLSFNTKIKSGYDLENINKEIELHNAYVDRVSSSFIQFLMSNYVYEFNNKVVWGVNDISLEHSSYKKDLHSKSIIRTGSNSFVVCNYESCQFLTDPISNKKIKTVKYNSILGNTCNIYEVDDIKGPIPEEKRTYCENILFSVKDFVKDTGFNPGLYLSAHFLNMSPEEERSRCSKYSMKSNCFEILLNMDYEDTIAKLNNNGFTYTVFLLKDKIENCYKNYIDINIGKNKCLNKAFLNYKFKLKYKNALAFEMFLKESIKVQKQKRNDWIISRITWDPTSFCKYATPVNILYSN